MKWQNRMLAQAQVHPDRWIMLIFLVATAGMFSLIPLVLNAEIANSPANHSALAGESGLWSALGAKD
ncbi:MAG: hypothetical protein EDM05_65800 [Leptolyngbya sp. IPPAS B-1204]|uniref:Uncharacterized protein n=1 Tax=Leptolyngbya sp. NK1-12 TaxID=2547451 RepID=A0AA97AL45_9CYAN|nr:hypothetical protein [Leptolyngbya sp. NK1-12]MBF2049488.1 hypothetical protein [Elainella sp. C42_A2020_010]RNJ68359.1 MAG: hypothetical protein EDM05_14670 [Leptolyngbya sp. IPPAS B-1204]WNZ24257.1 hypothetical protein HJG54_16260 [Leptolyngbya sp. NK1-12]